jgi:hypothetical protein
MNFYLVSIDITARKQLHMAINTISSINQSGSGRHYIISIKYRQIPYLWRKFSLNASGCLSGYCSTHGEL